MKVHTIRRFMAFSHKSVPFAFICPFVVVVVGCLERICYLALMEFCKTKLSQPTGEDIHFGRNTNSIHYTISWGHETHIYSISAVANSFIRCIRCHSQYCRRENEIACILGALFGSARYAITAIGLSPFGPVGMLSSVETVLWPFVQIRNATEHRRASNQKSITKLRIYSCMKSELCDLCIATNNNISEQRLYCFDSSNKRQSKETENLQTYLCGLSHCAREMIQCYTPNGMVLAGIYACTACTSLYIHFALFVNYIINNVRFAVTCGGVVMCFVEIRSEDAAWHIWVDRELCNCQACT